jgi:hypothetical protein
MHDLRMRDLQPVAGVDVPESVDADFRAFGPRNRT